tara:strand:+ start:27 stop:404 length:378 start_codon:yes stop_codon:yes gene_type:complete
MSTTNTIKTFGKSTNATDSATLANETVNPIQVDQVLFDEVKSFLSTKNFKDDDSLEVMALIIADIHKKSEIPLDELIGQIDSNDVATLTNKALALVNKLRPVTSQVGVKLSRLSTKPYVKRSILA